MMPSNEIPFAAPAWTPVFWLVGIGLVSSPYVDDWTWLRPIYFGSVFVFLAAHVTHAWLVHRRESSSKAACNETGGAGPANEN